MTISRLKRVDLRTHPGEKEGSIGAGRFLAEKGSS